MSRLTRAVAVAVNACRLTPGSSCRSRAELPVLGPEIVSPLADAVRFVDRDEADAAWTKAGGRNAVAAFADQPLGRHVQQAVAAGSRRPATTIVFFVQRESSC